MRIREAWVLLLSRLGPAPEKAIERNIHPIDRRMNPLKSQEVPVVSICVACCGLAIFLSSLNKNIISMAAVGRA